MEMKSAYETLGDAGYETLGDPGKSGRYAGNQPLPPTQRSSPPNQPVSDEAKNNRVVPGTVSTDRDNEYMQPVTDAATENRDDKYMEPVTGAATEGKDDSYLTLVHD